MAELTKIKTPNNTTYELADKYSEWGGYNLLKNIPKSQNTTGYNFLQLNLTENLVAGETYILQLWDVVLDSNSSGIMVYWGGGSVNLTSSGKKPTDGYISWILTPTAANASGSGATNLWLNLYNFTSGDTGQSCTVGKWNLEKGHKATDWSPCWADIFTYASDTITMNI